jgi:enoyl-CoA hydratase/carnithine racemase
MAGVITRFEDGVAIVSLNRPEKHNAIDDATSAELRDALHAAIANSEARAILLRGEGASFCSGRDTTQLGQRAHDESDFAFVRRAQDGRLAMLDAPKPIIGALKGHVIGGGMEMALACDIRVAATDVRMRLPEILYGILPDTGGTQLLGALIGPSKTKYLVMTGEALDAQLAEKWGMVDFVVPPDQLDARALAIAKQIAANSPMAVAMAKQLVDQQWADTMRRGTRLELLAQTTLFKSADYQEARAALREKRAPKFSGK